MRAVTPGVKIRRSIENPLHNPLLNIPRAHISFPNGIEMASPIDLTASDDDGKGLYMLEHSM